MADLEKKKYWIWLSLIPNLGSTTIQKLLKLYKNPEVIFQLTKKELSLIKGIGSKTIENMLDKHMKENLNQHIQYMIENKIDIISIYDENYPPILKKIYNPPISLYSKGDTSILKNPSMAIIGCREGSEYGKKAAKYFSYHVVQKGLNVVSGLAKGVDSYAHIGALCGQMNAYSHVDKVQNCVNCGKTIAIVGNGLDTIYPKENERLENQIIENGGVILSEYPLNTKPEKMNFPARNRIISGISKAILVVEAKEKSGTMLTVDFALEQGRDVFVVPGNINSINSVGTNRLIQQGAKLVANYHDLFM
ncbi:MAG: DNA-protecting protein DprA [Clostridia bacterium]|nr:DNA-protecting protein DprA [Clostridia bacterium]